MEEQSQERSIAVQGSETSGKSRESALTRSIGLPGAAGFGLGAMVGTGVFVYTGVAAGMAGAAVLASLVLAGIAAACNGLSSAELASVYPRSGGTYEHAGRLLSPWAGPLAKVNAASSPFVAVALVGVLVGALVPVRSVETLVKVSAFTVLVYYGLTNLSALRLKREQRFVHPAVPWAGLAFCVALAEAIPVRELLWAEPCSWEGSSGGSCGELARALHERRMPRRIMRDRGSVSSSALRVQ